MPQLRCDNQARECSMHSKLASGQIQWVLREPMRQLGHQLPCDENLGVIRGMVVEVSHQTSGDNNGQLRTKYLPIPPGPVVKWDGKRIHEVEGEAGIDIPLGGYPLLQ